jgi:hypothetical protein
MSFFWVTISKNLQPPTRRSPILGVHGAFERSLHDEVAQIVVGRSLGGQGALGDDFGGLREFGLIEMGGQIPPSIARGRCDTRVVCCEFDEGVFVRLEIEFGGE